MNRTIRVSAAGDILIMKRLLPGYQDVLPIREFLMQGEVRMANLETTISDGSCYASAYSGGTWLTADAKCLEDTLRYGFNFLGISNNHTMDYSYEGLASTISELKKGCGICRSRQKSLRSIASCHSGHNGGTDCGD